MSLRKRIPAGIADSSFASAATFGVSVFAARYLDPAGLGVYSVFFSAFLLATIVPTSLVFTPARVRLLDLPARQRIAAYWQTQATGAPVSAGASLLMAIAVPSALATGRTEFVVPMTATAIIAAFLSPIQDHLRAIFHLGGESWAAAVVSAVQMTAVAAYLGIAMLVDIDTVWVPFGGLVAANTCSLAVGMLIVHSVDERAPDGLMRLREVRRSGGWYLTADLLGRAADFLARTAVVAVATADVLGVAEGARIAARPLGVFTVGVSAVILPRSMAAGQDGEQRAGRRIARWSNVGVLTLALAYLAVGGTDWDGNLIARLAPVGYTVAWLVPATIGATMLQGMLFAERGEMMGGGRERELARIELVAAIAFASSGLLAGVLGPFVIPLGMSMTCVTRWIGYRRVLTRHYREHRRQSVEVQAGGAA